VQSSHTTAAGLDYQLTAITITCCGKYGLFHTIYHYWTWYWLGRSRQCIITLLNWFGPFFCGSF